MDVNSWVYMYLSIEKATKDSLITTCCERIISDFFFQSRNNWIAGWKLVLMLKQNEKMDFYQDYSLRTKYIESLFQIMHHIFTVHTVESGILV